MKNLSDKQTAMMLRPQHGFTLVELMVTVAVAIIMLAIAVPGYNDITRANKLSTNVNAFVQALHLARSEGVKSGGATLCASDNGTSCSGGDWTKGWILFSDFNLDGALGAGETILRVGDAMPSGSTMPTALATQVTYAGTGFLSPAGTNLTFVFCGGRTGTGAGRTVSVNPTGRPNTANYDSCS